MKHVKTKRKMKSVTNILNLKVSQFYGTAIPLYEMILILFVKIF